MAPAVAYDLRSQVGRARIPRAAARYSVLIGHRPGSESFPARLRIDGSAGTSPHRSHQASEKREFAGAEGGVWANGSWLLFTKGDAPPESQITSPIWHMGWGGGGNMKETYQKQLDAGTKFHTPLTDISDQCDGKGGNGRFLFAYIDAPDHALIELNTTAAGVTRFGHVHLLSNDPIAA